MRNKGKQVKLGIYEGKRKYLSMSRAENKRHVEDLDVGGTRIK